MIPRPLKVILKAIRYTAGQVVLHLSPLLAAALNRLVTGNQAYDSFSRHGFHLLRKHYYLPIPDESDLRDPMLDEPSQLVGVDLNEAAALRWLTHVWPKYQLEFRHSFPLHRQHGSDGFYLINEGFMAGDAHVYYAMIREHRPRRIVEVGGGNSSILAAAACLKNRNDFGIKPHLSVIEPYPNEILKRGVAGLDELIPKRVQEVELGVFESLQAGDICFIDSSHVLKPGGDVQREYCEILPRLAPGVLVHIHDISLPKPYFRCYLENHLYWNEQYLLQALLTFNPRFEVIWPGTAMFVKHPQELMTAFPEITAMKVKFPLAEPSSFWLRVREPAQRALPAAA
jgi:hypothetical protein